MPEASPEDRARIAQACQEGRVETDAPEALDRCMETIQAGGEPDFTVTFAELEAAWGKHKDNDGGFLVRWQTVSGGFGEVTFYIQGDKLRCDNEAMSKSFIKDVLAALVDTTELDS